MNFKCLLFIAVSSLLSLSIVAQKDSLGIVPPENQKVYGLKVSFAQLITPFIPSTQLAFEHSGKKGRFWRHQAGMYFDFGYKDQEAIEQLKGIRLQTGLRKYKSKYSKSTSFREFSLDYRYLDILIGGDFNRANFNFQQRINYNMWQHSFSLNYIWGQSIYLNSNWHFDVGIGLGIKINERIFSTIPKNTSFSTNGSDLLWRYGQYEGTRATLSVPFIFSVGYTWW